ncbi:MAG: exopolysaccharide biosynthesis polyprenyl glycosylphosphotransferase, partial [Acidobacteriota bacterium]|nr:exopolysaccharide biosynthesis polyprenyl glycosylphosphotransferase [Acidobacteriota bacterium]
RELGHQIIGFVDDKAATSHLGYRGLPLLGPLKETEDILQREDIDILYLTLPPEDQIKMLALIEIANRECIEIKVVPNLLQFMVLKAGLEDMDGIPIIRVNDVPLHGFNSALKRFVDISLSTVALGILAAPMAVIAMIVKRSSPGPALYKQERMGLDGQSFTVYKFRSMTENAEKETGPMWSRENDPRRTRLGILLRRFHFDELPQLWNVLRGDMSLVGPRPERPYFVEQFKQRIPHYMLRHKVKSGITGWAQVNGWRGNTSVEKRIEFDLYYIENWSIGLDFRILWLTIARGIFHIHAF